MNYIKEMNAFYNRLETNPLSASAINLWYALMHINNRAGWQEEFTVAVSVLGVKTSLSESALKRARMELQEKGYIRYRSQGGNRAAVYEMISLVIFDGNGAIGGSTNDNASDSVDRNVSDKPDGNASALYKQDKTKQNKRTTTGAHEFFLENFSEMSTYIAGEITRWVNETSETFVLVAMKRALVRGKANWGYVMGILKGWMEKGIASVDDAMEEEAAFRNRREKRSYGVKQVREVVPDWFKEREMGGARKKIQVAKNEVLTAEQEEVARLLAKYGG